VTLLLHVVGIILDAIKNQGPQQTGLLGSIQNFRNRNSQMQLETGVKSMGAAIIPGIVTMTRKFMLRLTPDENGKPQAPTEKSLMDILRMMKDTDKKAWMCII
jgi:hypothetical protein